MSSSVDQIKSKIDVVSLISSYIKLEKAGNNFKGRCPFHNEKTPSFFVSPDRGSYYCFGCHVKGDIFTFVQEFEGLDFIGSLKVLADKAGVELEQYNKGEKSQKDKLYSVLETAVFFYEKNLQENKAALDYLVGRGLKPETIKNFRIGYSPLEWRDLFEYLKGKGFSEKEILSVGLIKKKEGSASYYDTFRGRIMFPINDSAGRAVGFSGRILVDEENAPKYLNSPETELFNKSDILFGLDKAKKDIRLKDYSILVEGQMDLVMLHQAGITNAVASSGTALTETHLTKIRRLSNRIIMAYDGDSAGFMAANRSSQLALSMGMDLKIAQMPEGKDPADLVREGVDQLKDVLRGSKHIIDFYTDVLLGRGMDGRKLGQEIVKNVLPYVAILPSSTEQSHFIKSIAQKTFIKEEALWDDLKNTKVHMPQKESSAGSSPPHKKIEAMERKVYGIMLWQKSKKEKTEGVDILDLERKVMDLLGEKIRDMEESHKSGIESLLFEIESYYESKTGVDRDINYLLLGLEEEYLKEEFRVAMVNLETAEREKNIGDIEKYLKECQRLSGKINTIKNTSYEKK